MNTMNSVERKGQEGPHYEMLRLFFLRGAMCDCSRLIIYSHIRTYQEFYERRSGAVLRGEQIERF